jgi:hypothetical protein
MARGIKRGDDRVKGEERNDSKRSENVTNKGEEKVRTKKGIYWDFIFINQDESPSLQFSPQYYNSNQAPIRGIGTYLINLVYAPKT